MKGHNTKRRYYAWRMDPQGLRDAGTAERAVQAAYREAVKTNGRPKDTSNVPQTGNGLTRNKRKPLNK